MTFCLGGITQTATGCHSNTIEFLLCTFLSQMYKFLSQYYSYHTMTLNLETQTFPMICILSRLEKVVIL